MGYVIHDNEEFEEEKRSGILCLEAYSDEDWEKYGDNIALENTMKPKGMCYFDCRYDFRWKSCSTRAYERL